MSNQFFHKPENALKRANELLHVGNKIMALQLLHELDLDVVAGPLDLLWRRRVVRRRVEHVRVDRRGRVLADEGERLDRPSIVAYQPHIEAQVVDDEPDGERHGAVGLDERE